MIEIIYDKSKDDTAGTALNSGETNDRELFKLPKNIRQIGNSNGNRRIYIEDYVVTYLNYISRPGSSLARGAILLGEIKHTEVGEAIFISGAVDAQNIELDMDENTFSDKAWSEIYEEIKDNFGEISIVGWFLSRMGFSTAVNSKIEKLHVENFSGRNKVLYITDSLESEDAFYMYEKGQMVKQTGYFIYYAQNEKMQNYIIKKKVGVVDESNVEINRKDEELVKRYREKNNIERGGGINLLYVASSFVVIVMLAMGITVASNYDKMKDMEISINRLKLTAEEQYSTVEAMATTETKINTVSDASNVIEEKVEDNTRVEDITTEQSLPAISKGNPTYYIVKEGDTLSSISYKAYGTIAYMARIAEANKMSLEDKIYEGDQILLPVID